MPAFLLHQYPTGMVRIACKKSPRAGQYQKGNLIAAQSLPSMLQLIAKCEKHGNFSDWCGAYYVELATK